ncbi:hypothetical protein MLD38_000257 [Melastoma candidum]|uniref:Uncharacterized protein n=1 Tax=Melastoma candidum TaxID=119954 RepID=A0ACB9SBF3_9MYRT|nr:hypothetical protein MLD38_000257 [Melastoma candidum]
MNSGCYLLRSWPTLCLCLGLSVLLPPPSLSLSSDGILLLSLKYSILVDPSSVLLNWNYDDLTPCGWTGVNCTEIYYPARPNVTSDWRVTSLSLRGAGLIGSIPNDVGMMEYLAALDLSSNSFNGSLPVTLFNSSTKYVNLSGNSLWGAIPSDFGSSLEVLDLSLNQLNASLPANAAGGTSLSYFNVSHNMISGRIPLGFASKFPENATIDLSFNNLSGSIPESSSWDDRKSDLFTGNAGLCGKPLRILCSVPSTLSTPPNSSATATATPAIAVIPKPTDSAAGASSNPGNPIGRLRAGTIVGIAVGDLAGVGAIAIVILYAYQTRKSKLATASASDEMSKGAAKQKGHCGQQPTKSDPIQSSCPCLRAGKEETSEYSTTSESGDDNERKDSQELGVLTMVDGETQMKADTLLKAMAYMLGSSASSIVYKAVLENGVTYAVRRIGECRVRKLKEFENAVRAIEKVRHPNVVRVRGFYWGKDEKLLICDYAPNGSLASVIANGYTWRNTSSSQAHLTLEARLKIARGVARGLAYIHEKKLVHGRIKPSNILLSSEDDPLIGDLGLERLVCGFAESTNSSSSGPQSGQLLRTASHKRVNNPYQPPEARESASPWTSKQDVYSYGVVLLELLTGRPVSDAEIVWDRTRAMEMVEAGIREEAARGEEAYVACFEVGMRCAGSAPQRRPGMKEVAQVIEKAMVKLDLGSSAK